LESEIRRELQFTPKVLRKCNKIIKNFRKNTEKEELLIGVHARRGDFLSGLGVWMGFVAPGKDYLLRAMRHMRENLQNRTIKFLMFGDDFEWNSRNFGNSSEFEIILMKGGSPPVDMCILSRCNHIIISTGTFGWWCAFFNEGIVIYSKNYAKKGSALENQYVPANDYFMPHWIGL